MTPSKKWRQPLSPNEAGGLQGLPPPAEVRQVTYDLQLSGATAALLLDMTPYQWKASPELRAGIGAAAEMVVTVDVRVVRYQL